MTQSDPKIIEELADKWYQANGKKIYSDYDPRFAFIAGAKYQSEQGEWISVEDALPENNENVLCYNGYRMIENSYSMYTDQDQNWFKKKFTHWQSLPNPPQK